MKTEEGTERVNESPCLECPNMVNCNKMCFERLHWGVYEADKEDEELLIYGNNIKVQGSKRIKFSKYKDKYQDQDEVVQALLRSFDNIYRTEVVGYILAQQARKEYKERHNR